VFVVITLVEALRAHGEQAEQACRRHGGGVGIGERRADLYRKEKAGQRRAFQPQDPCQRGAPAALEHDGKDGGGHGHGLI
jgi:hypothetical protein